MVNKSIYQHFDSSEKEFIDRVEDWLTQYGPVRSYFLNPRERYIAETLANQQGIDLRVFPEQTEYAKLIFAPVGQLDFDVALLQIDYNSRFKRISHSQILGTFLGETGLDRREIGDIYVTDGQAQIFVSAHLEAFFIEKIQKIAGLPARLTSLALDAPLLDQPDSKLSVILASSRRIDKILASALKISRNLALNMVQSGKVKLNYREITKNDLLLTDGDLLSIRGTGRIRLIRGLGMTKKDKEKIEIETILNRR